MKCSSCDLEAPDDAPSCPSCSNLLETADNANTGNIGDTDTSQTKIDRKPTSLVDAPSTLIEHPGGGPSADETRQPAFAEAQDDVFAPGSMLTERYRIMGVLGQGGMGVVYRADDLTLGQTVALKFLPDSKQGQLDKLAALLHEVKIAREVAHPNVCSVYDVGRAGRRHFLSMKYVDGQDLSSLLAQVGRLPQAKGLEMARQICLGLTAAHEKEVLHRDLKPANLLIDRAGNALVTDFGLANLVDNLREDSTIVGTPAYMAPEQHLGRAVSTRTDLYALGLVFYEMFTGERAFPGRTPIELARLHAEVAPTPPARLVKDLDPALERVILRCLAKDPNDRPTSAMEVAEALPGGASVSSDWRPTSGHSVFLRSNWLLERKLGVGGFGESWCAVHKQTQERRVFKFCHDPRKLRALQREISLFLMLREKLGDRDDISRILDWNFENAPYFIEAEYTPGGNLIEWTEGQGGVKQVPVETRLEVVAQLADALAAAHSVGVLHKDVKPANVLITPDREGQPRAKLTDFGMADGGMTHGDMTTHLESISGTRFYMAPELLEGKGATLETDVYALGVLLYQLVVGDFSRALVHDWSEDIRDEVLREDIGEAVNRSARQRLKAQQLAERLRQLDRRRQIHEERLWQQQEAEAARTALARGQRRRKLTLGFIGSLLIVLALISIQILRVNQARDLASQEAERANQQAERANGLALKASEAAKLANRETLRAQQAAAEARQLSEYLADVFSGANLGEILDRGAVGVVDLGQQPELQADLMQSMGKVYGSLERYKDALPLLESALEMKRARLGDEHADVIAIEEEIIASQFDLAQLWTRQGRFAEAEALIRQTQNKQQNQAPSAKSWRVAAVDSLLGECLVGLEKYEEAEPLLSDAHKVLRIELGKSADETRQALRRLISLYEAWGRKAMVSRFQAILDDSENP